MMPTFEPNLPTELRAALQRGWPVLPVHCVRDSRCSCGRPNCPRAGKHPIPRRGHLEATTDEVRLLAWRAQYPTCNWGVVTGERSGILVLDVDGANGRTSLTRLEASYGVLPLTLTCRTGRDDEGTHLYFAHPPGLKLRCSAGKIAEGLDIRANGGYAIIPPSIHASGQTYTWVDPGASIADSPGWLISSSTRDKLESSGDVIPEGRRDVTLISLAGAMRRRGLSDSSIRSHLHESI